MDDGKTEKKINFDFEPFRPINQSMYFCGGKFQTEPLKCLLADDEKFGFIIVDGNGALYATLQGNSREILQKITVELPKKHRKGGQSSVRFARLREEKRHNYLRKVAELAGHWFVTNDKVNVSGLVLAGNAGFKTELSETDMLDKRLVPYICSVVDVQINIMEIRRPEMDAMIVGETIARQIEDPEDAVTVGAEVYPEPPLVSSAPIAHPV